MMIAEVEVIETMNDVESRVSPEILQDPKISAKELAEITDIPVDQAQAVLDRNAGFIGDAISADQIIDSDPMNSE